MYISNLSISQVKEIKNKMRPPIEKKYSGNRLRCFQLKHRIDREKIT